MIIESPRFDIKEIRQRLKISKERLARVLDVSPRTVFRWERKLSAPQELNYIKLADFMARESEHTPIIWSGKNERI